MYFLYLTWNKTYKSMCLVLPIHEDGAHVLKTVRGVQGTNMVWVQVGKSTSL